MNKRIITAIALVCAVCMVSGYGNEAEAAETEVTFEQFYEANLTDVLLKGHSSMMYSVEGEMLDSLTGTFYYDSEYYGSDYGTSQEVQTSKWHAEKTEDSFITGVMLAREAEFGEQYQDQLLNGADIKEELTSQYVEDGKRYLITKISGTDMETFLSYFSDDIVAEEGSYLEMTYETDADTLQMSSAHMVLNDGNGKSQDIYKLRNITFDEEIPAYVTEIKEEYERIQNETEGIRTLTLIKDPGSEEETTITVKGLLGTSIQIFPSKEYQNAYWDKECTKIVNEALDVNADATVYMKKNSNCSEPLMRFELLFV